MNNVNEGRNEFGQFVQGKQETAGAADIAQATWYSK